MVLDLDLDLDLDLGSGLDLVLDLAWTGPEIGLKNLISQIYRF